MSHNLRCGVGKADITPPLGTMLYGYPPARPAEAVGDGLEAVAILLKSNEGSALLISCTLCATATQLAGELRAIAGEACGIDPDHVSISCTHTHSGPNTSLKSGWGDVDYPYIENILKPGIREAAQKALASLVPAKMGIGVTDSDVGINRRQVMEDGSIELGQNPWGVHDPKMTVISFRGEDGKTIANMIHYGCHNTASGKNPEITRDWSGVMTDMLEAETGGISAFFNGFEGDQGPNLPNGRTTGTYPLAIQLGGKAGIDAVRAWRNIKEYRDAPVRVLNDTVRIPFDALPAKEVAQEHLAQLGSLEQLYAQDKCALVNEFLHWSNVLAEYESCGPKKTHFTFEQAITTIGPVAILPAPFETFAEIGLRIRVHSPYPYSLSLCNTNGSLAYLPTKNDIPSGGYEIWQFLLAMRTTYPLPRNTDDYWVSENLRILREQ